MSTNNKLILACEKKLESLIEIIVFMKEERNIDQTHYILKGFIITL